MTVVWQGNVHLNDGYSNTSRAYVRGLKKAGIDVVLRPQGFPIPDDLIENYNKPDPVKGSYYYVFHSLPSLDVVQGQVEKYVKESKKSIYMTVWEGSFFPSHWLVPYSKFDQIIVPSTFCADALKRTARLYGYNLDIDIVLHIIKRYEIGKLTRSYTMDQGDIKILALSAGAGYRKGIDLLISGFLNKFKKSDGIVLYIKTHNTDIYSRYEHLFNTSMRIKGDQTPLIININGEFDDSSINDLYHQTDIFAMTSRGEGFCVPLAEAAVTDRRVVYPAGALTFGNQSPILWADDFLSNDRTTGYGVKSAWNQINGHEFSFDRLLRTLDIANMQWVEPLIYDIGSTLFEAANNVSIGKNVYHPKIRNVSEETVTQQLIEVLNK